MKKTIKIFVACLAISLLGATAAFAGETPVAETAAAETAAEEVKTVSAVSTDGLINILLPDSSWQEVEDDLNNEVFSDGNSKITFNIYKKGDTNIPERPVTDETHKLISEHYEMDEDYVYIATACIHEESDYDAVVEAMDSIVINRDKITDEILDHEVPVTDTHTVKDANYDVWVNTDVLNVRAGYSTETEIVGAVTYGTKLQATGIVYDNGVEAGWTRINYNGTTAYVGSGFLTTTEPQTQPETQPETQTEPETESEYIGYTYGGTDPWGGQLSVTLRYVDNGTLDWTFTDFIDDDHMIYRELDTPYANGYTEWYIEGTIGDDYDMNYNYAGNLKLQGGYVEFTYTSGECVTLSPEGDSTSHMVEALEGNNTVALEKQY